jgi:hypothetical protein
MLLLLFLQQNGVEITPKIQALIDKFGDRWIPKQFQNDFWKRVRLLKETNLFGKGFDYLSDEFMIKFPKFEVLFVKMWLLIHDIPTFPSVKNKAESYCYDDYLGHSVIISLKNDSVQIVIPNGDDYPVNVVNFTFG